MRREQSVFCEREDLLLFFLNGSEEEIKLCEGSRKTAGEKRKTPTSATGAQGEESSGTSIVFHIFFVFNSFNLLNLNRVLILCHFLGGGYNRPQL